MLKKQVMAVVLAVAGFGLDARAARIDFAKGDTDGDGRLTSVEFSAAFAEANPTIPERAAQWFPRIDQDQDGAITEKEFKTPRAGKAPEKPAVEEGSFEEKAAGLHWECVPDPKLPNVLILGDSISIGYTLKVRELLHGKANVYRPLRRNGTPDNCFTVENGIENLASWIGTQTWSVIHFNFGLHDLNPSFLFTHVSRCSSTLGLFVALQSRQRFISVFCGGKALFQSIPSRV